MINTEFLTPDEIAALTGLKQAGAQMRWLTANDIKFLVSHKSKPMVNRYALRLKMAGAEPATIEADKSELEYNFNFKKLK